MPRSAFAVRNAVTKTLIENKTAVPSPEVILTSDKAVIGKQSKKNNLSSRKKRKRVENDLVIDSRDVVADNQPEDTKQTGNAFVESPSQSGVEDRLDIDSANTNAEALTSISIVLPGSAPVAAAKNTPGLDIVWDDSCRNAEVKLPAGQSLAAVGEYDLWLKKGNISILGAMMQSSIKLHRVYAPTTHSIPVVKALVNPFGPSLQTAELHIQSASSGVRNLRRCNPRFSRIWSKGHETAASFSLLSSDESDQNPQFTIPTDWERHVNALCDINKIPVVMVCGPKNAGKSSLARYLVNSFLSRRYAESGVAYLDLDPGQPEYTTPADLSLVHVRDFNTGPAFTHFANSEVGSNRLIRQHHFGHFSPREDLGHYLDCARDLYEHYKQGIQRSGCPLVINTSGWIQGLGLEVLSSLAKRVLPTHVISLTSEIDDEAGSVLQESISKLGGSFSTLSARSGPSGPRSAADLRSMQFSSFFHLEASESEQHRWNSEMLSFTDTVSLAYSGHETVISGTLLLGNHVSYDSLEFAIDKTVMALVAIQPSSLLHAIIRSTRTSESQHTDTSDTEMQDKSSNAPEASDCDSDAEAQTTLRYDLRYNKQGIPYLACNSRVNPPVDPATSHSLGQIMLNRIDTVRKKFDGYTSISLQTIKSSLEQGMELILVGGRLGMPEWAYLEEYSLSKAIQEDSAELLQQSKSSDAALNLDLPSLAQRTPYVEYEDYQGMAGLNKARRVRRNLGTTGNKV